MQEARPQVVGEVRGMRFFSILVIGLVLVPLAPTSAQSLLDAPPAFLVQAAKNLGVLLPPTTRITKPASEVPQETAQFSGGWGGRWEGVLGHVLVVEEIRTDFTATVVYAWGTAPQWRITQPGWTRVQGAIAKGELLLALSSGVRVTYRMRGVDTLDGTYVLRGQITRGTFQQLKE